jgi:hypothetical protein
MELDKSQVQRQVLTHEDSCTKSEFVVCVASGFRLTTSLTGVLLMNFFQCGYSFNPLNADLNPIGHLLALLGAHHNLHVSRIRVNSK